MTGVILGAVLVLLILEAISVRRRLTVMDENISHVMGQIGVQLSSCLKALDALLELTEAYAAPEAQALADALRSRRSVISAQSAPDDVMQQRNVISETLDHIFMLAKQYPELKASESYAVCVAAADSYQKMVYTSCLIYNDGVTKLNRELRLFPASLLGRLFGFRPKTYLVTPEDTITGSV